MKIIENIEFLGSEPFTRGGFAGLYKALLYSKEFTKSEMVVVKVPDRCRIASGEGAEWIMGRAKALERWQREMRAGQAVVHPNVLQVLGFCDNPDPEYKEFLGIVLPFCANGNARAYIQAHVDVDRLRILVLVGSALFALHFGTPPVIHGDIKGENILIDEHGKAFLADFGLSRICEVQGFTTKTVAGSIRWMAPELLRASGNISPTPEDPIIRATKASDIWAFGMTILELLTGALPFSECNDLGVIVGVMATHARPRKPSCINEAIWTLLERCWTEDPASRPSARHVGLVLDLIYCSGRKEFDVPLVSMILNGALDHLYPRPLQSEMPQTQPTSRPYACKWFLCSQTFDNIDSCINHEREELIRRVNAAGCYRF